MSDPGIRRGRRKLGLAHREAENMETFQPMYIDIEGVPTIYSLVVYLRQQKLCL